MSYHLKPYPNSRCDAVTGIAVDLARTRGGLDLRYVVVGAIAEVRWPVPARSSRTDGLWQHTCFEAFVREEDAPGYCEFNFSPSGAWAAYRFSGYREGMNALDIAPPRIESRNAEGKFELSVSLGLPVLAGVWKLGISAVIEETSGRKSYWALAHPAAKPDFHHADSFTLDLPA